MIARGYRRYQDRIGTSRNVNGKPSGTYRNVYRDVEERKGDGHMRAGVGRNGQACKPLARYGYVYHLAEFAEGLHGTYRNV